MVTENHAFNSSQARGETAMNGEKMTLGTCCVLGSAARLSYPFSSRVQPGPSALNGEAITGCTLFGFMTLCHYSQETPREGKEFVSLGLRGSAPANDTWWHECCSE
jgi:hypothetical protein